MKQVRRAVIDVGTNSVKLLVADVAQKEVQPVLEKSKQTRLGRGLYEASRLQEKAIAATAQAVAGFAEEARQSGAASIRIVATSAARDALNAKELMAAIERASALKVELISGRQEANWVFAGVNTDPRFAGQKLLLLDVGGGSTEFILGQDDRKYYAGSFPLGSVRLMEQVPHSDSPTSQELLACRQWLKQFLKGEVQPQLEGAIVNRTDPQPTKNIQLVGTGGTATILARMEGRLHEFDRERIEATSLSLERVHWHTEHLWTLPLADRKNIVGLPPNRADVILTGAAIYEAIMDQFEFAQLHISTRGLRFAVVMDGS